MNAVSRGAASSPSWALSGTYLEACNCDVICACRRIGGRTGGRSSYGICMGALSWAIERGRAGDADLAGQRVVLVGRYDDDETRSPWDFFLYLDESADVPHTSGRGWFRAGDEVEVRVAEAVSDREAVTCIIPGHHQAGAEVHVDELRSTAAPLEYAFSGRCGYEASFAYSSDDGPEP